MRDTTQLFQEPSASQHQATIALNYIHELLCFIFAYLVHPLSRCVLRVNCVFTLWPVWLTKLILLSDSGGEPVNLDDLVSVHFK